MKGRGEYTTIGLIWLCDLTPENEECWVEAEKQAKKPQEETKEKNLCLGQKERGYRNLGSCFELWDMIPRFMV